VIGVMLLLVVTIVIAGVVAVFGTGMVGDVESAPNVVLDVKILSEFEALTGEHGTLKGPDFQIRHVSGDPLDTGEIEIQMAWTASDGEHYSTYSAAEFAAANPNGYLPTFGGSDARKQPMYMKVEYVPETGVAYTYGSVGKNYYFGDVVLTPGMRITASTDFLDMSAQKNVGSPFMDLIFNDGNVLTTSASTPGIMEFLPAGTPVEITILHIPSNTIIYEKEVVVQ